jgi:hypothetical protein
MPGIIEIVWTALSFLLLVASIIQWRISVSDYKAKKDQARYRNGTAHAGMKLAHYLAYTVLLDCVGIFAALTVGSLSLIRHYLTSLDPAFGILFVPLLFVILGAYGGRIVLRLYTRLIVNRL